MDFEEQPTRWERALTWVTRLSFLVFLLALGGAIGGWQTAQWLVQELEAQYICSPKTQALNPGDAQ